MTIYVSYLIKSNMKDNETNEGEEQDNPVLFDKEIDYHRYWKDMYEKEHKLRQEAETEAILVKGIGMNSPEMKQVKHRVKELENSLSIALEINERDQRYLGKIQVRMAELEDDNKKLAGQIEDQVERARKAGL